MERVAVRLGFSNVVYSRDRKQAWGHVPKQAHYRGHWEGVYSCLPPQRKNVGNNVCFAFTNLGRSFNRHLSEASLWCYLIEKSVLVSKFSWEHTIKKWNTIYLLVLAHSGCSIMFTDGMNAKSYGFMLKKRIDSPAACNNQRWWV